MAEGIQVGSAYLALGADSSGLQRDLDQADRGVRGWASKLSGVFTMAGAGLSAGLTAPLLMLGKKAIDNASDLNEATNKVQVVFGSAAKTVEQFTSTAVTSFGLTSAEARNMAGSLGALFTASGQTKQAAADMSRNILQLSADMGSMHNVDPTDMLDKLRSGLVGEAEPLRQFGILLSEDAVKAKAASMGLLKFDVDQSKVTETTLKLKEAQEKAAAAIKKYGEGSDEAAKAIVNVHKAQLALDKAKQGKEIGLTEEVKLQARYALILEKGAYATGDFANTSNQLANATRVANKQFEEMLAAHLWVVG